MLPALIRAARQSARLLALTVLAVACARSGLGSPAAVVAPSSTSSLPANAYHDWDLRAEHPDAILLTVGDSIDIVLMRMVCRDGRCSKTGPVSIAPRWLPMRPIVRLRTLPRRDWPRNFGFWSPAEVSVRARVYADREGSIPLIAANGNQQIAWTRISVIEAPGAVRVEIEPRPDSVYPGETIRVRATARDRAGRVVTILPVYNSDGVADRAGFTTITAPQSGRLFHRVMLGRRGDSISVPVRR
jgi:hypothetical protein